ncbi:MBL fold metallo-hydrolase [Geodermatophilus chilensis]|uniref:MBL fold metallo-hydrolase n=1 Tax=Geodermatophilus chilensis TaxID=2035835 RepID=UPI000C26B197|nr:MBL fold metallo-hydrolase [Geodermatophilus chilensis]
MRSHRLSDDLTVLAHAEEIPGLGHLPVNAFVLHAEQPVLVDTGMPAVREEFLDLLWSAVDPADLRWIWLTHPDRDHTGAVMQVLDAAPQARLVTTFMGMGILSIEHPIPPDRVYLLNPGQSLDVGDRTLTAFRPPLFDSPATTGFVDDRTGACLSSDCFGAPMSSAQLALADDVAEVPGSDLLAGQRMWAVVDSPWVTWVDRDRYAACLGEFPGAGSPLILSTHLPPARDRSDELLDVLAAAPDVPPFVGPDQAALEAMLAGLAPEPRAAQEAAVVAPT